MQIHGPVDDHQRAHALGEDRRQVGHLPAPAGRPDLIFDATALAELGRRRLGVYIHVPFCATRCGYCSFVTYTRGELGSTRWEEGFADAAIAEVRLLAAAFGGRCPPAATVFFGGGTPTLLPPADLLRILDAVRAEIGLLPGAEVTVEANPDSVTERSLGELRGGGVTRVSFGMQSVRRHVLAVLQRTHAPGRPEAAVADARRAGFEHVNLDLIYGTPGERDTDWRATLDSAIAAGPDHVSAYALSIEAGTRLSARVRHGDLPAPDDDVLADRYAVADDVLLAAGFRWYEVSNWSTSVDARCAHNLIYWRNDDWLAVGPGAHGHVGGVRWWNVRHPRRHAELVAAGRLAVDGFERCAPEERVLEDLLLGVRLADGIDGRTLAAPAVDELVAGGLVAAEPWRTAGRVVLTRTGRLLTDRVILRLADDMARADRVSVAPVPAP